MQVQCVYVASNIPVQRFEQGAEIGNGSSSQDQAQRSARDSCYEEAEFAGRVSVSVTVTDCASREIESCIGDANHCVPRLIYQ